MVPVSIEDTNYCLDILCVRIDDIVFTVAQVAAAAVAAESRACEVGCHDIRRITVDNQALLMCQREVRVAILRLNIGCLQLIQRARW